MDWAPRLRRETSVDDWGYRVASGVRASFLACLRPFGLAFVVALAKRGPIGGAGPKH